MYFLRNLKIIAYCDIKILEISTNIVCVNDYIFTWIQEDLFIFNLFSVKLFLFDPKATLKLKS